MSPRSDPRLRRMLLDVAIATSAAILAIAGIFLAIPGTFWVEPGREFFALTILLGATLIAAILLKLGSCR